MTRLPGPYDPLEAPSIRQLLYPGDEIGPLESGLIYVRLAYMEYAFDLSLSCSLP